MGDEFYRYAALRRQLLVDPHVPKDGSNSPDLTIDNPLSQNPGNSLLFGPFLIILPNDSLTPSLQNSLVFFVLLTETFT